MLRFMWRLLPGLLLIVIMPACSGGEFVLVEGGLPKAAIVLGADAGFSENKAATELVKYVRIMTGAELEVLREGEKSLPGDARNVVLIGRTGGQGMLERLEQRGLVGLSEVRSTPDAFTIKTASDADRNYLILAGKTTASPLYAVYEVLERFGRVGFFRYEEHVPRRPDFSVPEVALVSKPHFKLRMFGGQYVYWGYYQWDLAEWKKEIDWYVKRRVNAVEFLPFAREVVRNRWRQKYLGVQVADPSGGESRAFHQLGKQVMSYARSLGVEGILPRCDGRAPKEVREKFPDARYFQATLPSRAPEYFVYPTDPLYFKMQEANIEEFTKTYGRFKFFWAPGAYAERKLGGSPEESRAIQQAYARGFARVMKVLTPDGTWLHCSWAFNDRKLWTAPLLEEFFDSVPREARLIVLDLMAEENPCYRDFNYWYGRDWAFCILHSYGYDSYLHGDAGALIGQVHELLRDPRAAHMAGFGMMTEQRDSSPLYLDLAMKMCWEPGIGLDDFLKDYVARRYARASADVMLQVHRQLCETVYGPDGGNLSYRLLGGPFYFYRLGEATVFFDDRQLQTWRRKRYFVPKLRSALELALKVAPREADNAAYRRDIVDICRSYLQALFNLHCNELYRAFRAGDGTGFEMHARRMEEILQRLKSVVSTMSDSPLYSLQRVIEQARRRPGGLNAKQMRHWQLFVTPGGFRIYFYHRTDRAEMINQVYTPRVKEFIRILREQLEKGSREVPRKELAAAYDKIEDDFVEQPLKPIERPPLAAWDVARDVLASGLEEGAD